jgi:predicted transcriptional regulator
MAQSVLEMAKDLVLVQIESYRLVPEAVHQALRNTHANLMRLKEREEAEPGEHARTGVPVDWRKSITRQTVACLECGAVFKQLSSRHLQGHGLDRDSYRVKYGIPRTQALVARESTMRRRQIALQSRMWEKTPNFRAARRDTSRNYT